MSESVIGDEIAERLAPFEELKRLQGRQMSLLPCGHLIVSRQGGS